MAANGLFSYLFSAAPAAFCVRVVVLLGGLIAATFAPLYRTLVEEPLINVNAMVTYWLLKPVADVHLHGPFVRSAEFSMEIVSGCTGIFVFLFLVAAVLAFPSSGRQKLRALLGGALLIFVLNQIRIVSLFFVGRSFPDLFDDFHVYVWQGVIIVVVAFFWYRWAVRTQSAEQTGNVPVQGDGAPAA